MPASLVVAVAVRVRPSWAVPATLTLMLGTGVATGLTVSVMFWLAWPPPASELVAWTNSVFDPGVARNAW